MSPIKKPSIDLLLASLGMLSAWLSKSWEMYDARGSRLTVDLARSAEDARSLLRGSPDGEIRYPYCIGVLAALDADTARGAYSRKYIDVVTNQDKENVQLENLTPVRLGVLLNFRSTSIEDVLRFAHIFITSAPRVAINLSDESTDFIFECGIELEGSVALPQADMGHPAKHFSYDTTAIITTYTGMIRNASVIKTISMDIVNKTHPSVNQIKLSDLEDLELIATNKKRYTDLFDTTSQHYRKD